MAMFLAWEVVKAWQISRTIKWNLDNVVYKHYLMTLLILAWQYSLAFDVWTSLLVVQLVCAAVSPKDFFLSLLCTTHISACHVLYYCWLYTCRVSFSFLSGLGNRCTGELHQTNSKCFESRSATASFVHCNSFPGAKMITPQSKQQNWVCVISSAYNTPCVVLTGLNSIWFQL